MNLTNSHLSTAKGRVIADHKLSLRRTFLVLADGPVFIDTISVRNFSTDNVTLPLSLEFATTFESMFVLRGSPVGKRGQLQIPRWDGTALRFAYHGADDILRTLLVEFSLTPVLAPKTTEQGIAHFQLDLAPMATEELMVTCRVDERPVGSETLLSAGAPRSVSAMRAAQATASAALLDGYAGIETANQGLGEVLARSLTDIALLEVRRGESRFTTAGMPWFVGLFGRDSLLPTIQCLAYNPSLGARTAKALALWQGTRDHPFTREEPGKILHELRVGELAHLHEVSQTPSYASVDATLLFLIAVAKHVRWTGDLQSSPRFAPTSIAPCPGWIERQPRTRRDTSPMTASPTAANRSTKAGVTPGQACCVRTGAIRGRLWPWSRCRATPTRPAY